MDSVADLYRKLFIELNPVKRTNIHMYVNTIIIINKYKFGNKTLLKKLTKALFL